MNAENFEELKESLYRKGFGEHLNKELEKNLQAKTPEFALEHNTKIGEDEVAYKVHFRRDNDPEKDKVYLNKFDTAILKNADAPGQVLEHTFQAHQLITAMEAYRMLKHGDQVAVNKNLFDKEGQQYNTWISVDTKGVKDEYNNYPLKTFHEHYYQKYPFDLKEELGKMPVPVKELEKAQTLENIEKSLKKANLVSVTILLNGAETTGTLAVNPARGKVELYDKNMQLIEPQKKEQQKAAALNNDATPASTQEDVKKKSWDNQQQRVNWTKKDQNKGMSI